ncbi:HTH domain-containing protein [Paraburkholderia sp. CNPSo 3157]|uniref:HTH domain-containing protein n=1 Tax=Paraburkholderia franconis TaxID=2654983 RepID=A0A7X1NDP8_9BURK|nr:LuxR family transcriptional regulator [Paraburkholderia franconis]MPW20062.1 HTH domain-containing protein [Paraburkholderia franconis]
MDLSFDDLMNATDELELIPLVKEAVQSHGAEWFVFASLHPMDYSASRSTYRFLIGCRPEWCQLYNANRWYLTDPCLAYARTNTAPVLGSDLPVLTSGQQHILEVAAQNGFRSIYIVPAHASGKGRIGILYLGSSVTPEEGEPIFREGRPFFRALSLELLDWSSQAVRIEAMQSSGLTIDEIRVLRLVKAEFTANAIAGELGVSPTTVYRQFQRINEKVGVSHITAAVRFAEEHDILA